VLHALSQSVKLQINFYKQFSFGPYRRSGIFMMSDYIEGGSDDCVRDDNTRKVNFNLVLRSSGILRNVSCYLVVTFPYGLSIPSSRVKQSTENSSWTVSSFFR